MSVNGLSYDVVMQMVEVHQNEGYIVYTDNLYSSPTLFKELVNQGFGTVGTMDPTRWGCPAILKMKLLRPAYKRGYGVWNSTVNDRVCSSHQI